MIPMIILCSIFLFLAISIGSYFLFKNNGNFRKRLQQYISYLENKSFHILLILVILILILIGAAIFKRPYLAKYNQGNGAYYVQVLHNLSQGIGPEHTTKSNGSLYYSANRYYYASIFSVIPQMLPYMILTPLYSFYPYPPMHVFSVVIIVVIFGSIGVYWAIRALEGSRITALLGAITYCLLPWVQLPILTLGAFDNIGFAVYPYVFCFLFKKNWGLLYLSTFMLSLINMPYTYSTICLGIIISIFWKAAKQGMIVSSIGCIIMLWDMAIVRESLKGICIGGIEPHVFTRFLTKFNMELLIAPINYHIIFVSCLLLTFSFFPVLYLKQSGKINRYQVGMLIFMLCGVFMGLFRSYDITFHRNANIVAPLFFCAFMSFIHLCNKEKEDKEGTIIKDDNKKLLLKIVFFSGIASITLSYLLVYPLSPLRILLLPDYISTNKKNIQCNRGNHEALSKILSSIDCHVPKDASIAYRVDSGLEAFLTNRQNAWPLGYNPQEVEYFIIQTVQVSSITKDFPNWEEILGKITHDRNFKIVFQDDKLIIIQNLKPQAIPRPIHALGWDILYKAILPIN